MQKFATRNGVSLRAYKGDAMTLLAFDIEAGLKKDLAGFTILYKYKVKNKPQESYIYNRLKFPDAFFVKNTDIPVQDRNSTLYSPIQKMNWVHVPNTNINTQDNIFGDYTYLVTPRYIKNGVLQPLDNKLTVQITIDVAPFDINKVKIGFTRGFVSSVAYAKRFNANNNSVRPKGNKDKLLFDITQKADTANRWNDKTKKYEPVDYTFEEQHKWLGWQARQRILDFLDEAVKNKKLSIKAFIFDLDEPEICKRLLTLAEQNRVKIILDSSSSHGPGTLEDDFEKEFKKRVSDKNDIQRGYFKALAHSKVFIQMKDGKAQSVLTGSTNFSTNGLYVNSNHVLVFDSPKVAQLYSDVFDASFGSKAMDAFKGGDFSIKEFPFNAKGAPKMTITFAPHTPDAATTLFDRVSKRILQAGNTDILFAIMQDTNAGSILDAVKKQVQSDKVFTYGVTDKIDKKSKEYSVSLYKPNSLKGIRIAARGIANILPPPFGMVPKVDGYAIHHKFVVVNFKGKDPVVYCGSSNLAFGPEQKNGDNLLEIHDTDIVTAFAIQALGLVDHYQWRNLELSDKPMHLDDLSKPAKAWYLPWFDPKDLRNRQRKLYIQS